MAIFFSISPPPLGLGGINVPLIPDVEELIKFSSGDIGISDNIKKNFLFKSLSSSKFKTKESIKIFSELGGFVPINDIESYEKNGRYSIPEADLNLTNNTDFMGLKALEKTTLKTIFETQKPYMEFVPKFVEIMSKLEVISAKVLGTIDLSKNPKFNPKSLSSKLNESRDKLNQLSNLSKEKSKVFSNLSTSDKISGVDMTNELSNSNISESYSVEDFDWEIISKEYSTGQFISGIDYKIIYKNIIDPSIILDSSLNNSDDIIEDQLPPSIVFAYYNQFGRPIAAPTQWLDREYSIGSVGPTMTKWYGVWEQLEDNDIDRYRQFLREFIDDRLLKRIKRKDVELSDKIYNFVEPKINPKTFIKRANKNSFMNLIGKSGDQGLDIGNDSIIDVNLVTAGKKKMFLPKKISYNSKTIIVDPEADYNLQIIKIVPTKDVYYNGDIDVYNQNLKITTPFVGNYKGVNVRDSLSNVEYKKGSGITKRVKKIFKYNYNSDNTSISSVWDNKVAYMVEGVLKQSDKKKQGGSNINQEWYNKSSLFTAIKDFVDILISIFIETIPEVKSLIKLFKNPHELIFDIILEKMEDNFSSFNSSFMEKYSKIKNFTDKFERADYIRNDQDLNKFVSIDENLNYRFILDGFSGMELLGFNFGINIIDFLPKMVLDKSNNFSLNSLKESINGNSLPTQPKNKTSGNDPNSDKSVVNANIRKKQKDGTYKWETVSVKYSTGDFIKGSNYEYIYITEDVERLLSKADKLFELAGDSDRDKALDSLTNYNMALEKDPNNDLIKEKINELKDKFKFDIQMILQLLINLVSFPIKIILSILEEFLGFLKDMSTIIKMPDKLKEIASFEWVVKYVKPTAILDLLGLSFNPELLFKWLSDIKSNTIDPNFEFDLSEIVSAPFLFSMPKVSKEQLLMLKTKPLEQMTAIFKLIEQMVEGILCFIWNTLNIDMIIDCPKFNISKFAASDLPLEDLQSVLNGDSSALNSDNVPYKFIYNIKLSDGTLIKDLNYVELQQFIGDNKDLNYEVR